jgi:tetratricopeptide (TPR) repeat protein
MGKRNWMETLHWTSDHTEEIRHVAFAYIRQGKYDIAIPLFEALCILETDNVYDLQTLGALYVQINKPEKAIICLNKALQLDAEHGPTLLNLMKAFFMKGQIEEGKRLATILQKDSDPYIAGTAAALLMCYP